MNLNSLIALDGKMVDEKKPLLSLPNSSLFKSTNTQNTFPNHINLSCHMTKPEDQGSHGTCMAFSGTTFVESLLWKLTGEKEEFTVDELYNLYFDAWGADNSIVNALTRKELRGDGTWSGEWPDEYGGLSYERWYYQADYPFEFSLTDVDSSGADVNYKITLYYQMIHYNDPEWRKNHYPDKFSNICEKVKNYLFKKIYQENGFLSEKIVYPYWTGTKYVNATMFEVRPNRIKYHTQQTHMPMKASLPSIVGGHAVVFYDYDLSSVYFNSSWDDEKIYNMSLDYKNTTSKLSTDHYYSNFQSHSGYCWYNFIGIDAIDFYKETTTVKRKVTNLLPEFGSGHIYGVRSGDMLDHGRKITLIAIPDEGYYFKCWDDQFTTGEYCSNVREFYLTADISVIPCFTDREDDVFKVKHDLYIMSSDFCEVKCNSYIGELLSGDIPESKILSTQNTSWTYNSKVNLQVYPNELCTFVCWNDGCMQNPRTFILSSDMFAYPILSSK